MHFVCLSYNFSCNNLNVFIAKNWLIGNIADLQIWWESFRLESHLQVTNLFCKEQGIIKGVDVNKRTVTTHFQSNL